MPEAPNTARVTLPVPVRATLSDFEREFGLSVRLDVTASSPESNPQVAYESEGGAGGPGRASQTIELADGRRIEVRLSGREDGVPLDRIAAVLGPALERAFEADREAELFTRDLTERWEEIDLLYTISETLGSHVGDAADVILRQVCNVMGAREGRLWVQRDGEGLSLAASVRGRDGSEEEEAGAGPDTVTAIAFREDRTIIGSRTPTPTQRANGFAGDSLLAVPIRYTPPEGDARSLGVVSLLGRRSGAPFSSSDDRLLSAIASQVGAALENNRLVRESLSKERMAKEMELAKDLQQKLLPRADRFRVAEAAASVQPAEQVGGDFYQLFELSGGRVGVMLGDVSLHGFPSALIMTLTMSAAGIYAREHDSPAQVLRSLDDALREELENTEMFLTVFYGVVDPAAGTLCFSNAGHPHAFAIHSDGGLDRLTATDPPVGFAGPDAYGEEQVPWSVEHDLLLLFTDGLSDILASATRGDGEERVLDSVIAHRRRPAAVIVDELFALTADAVPPTMGDDRTALVVRF